MNPFYKFGALCLLSFSVFCSYAQTDTTTKQKESFFKIGVNFLSNDVYLGRADTVSTPTISPTLNYTFQSGVYFTAALDYITNRKKNNIDGGSLEAGYNYTAAKNFEGGVSVTKVFYNASSTQVSSTISSVLNAYADYNIADIITPSFSVFYNIGKSNYKNDLIINPSISHDFDIDGLFTDNDGLTISPQAGLNAGSQNYYAGYLEKKGKLNRKATTAAFTAYDKSLGDFKLLDYELSAPIAYHSGNFLLNITPTCAFGQDSLPKGTAAEKQITKNVELSAPYKPSIFYIEMGVALKF